MVSFFPFQKADLILFPPPLSVLCNGLLKSEVQFRAPKNRSIKERTTFHKCLNKKCMDMGALILEPVLCVCVCVCMCVYVSVCVFLKKILPNANTCLC